ncbi:kinase-like domain-containing protein [Mycena metata]|uniref:Kinase-like domain-containing protein n=1 Tax=Mycena metata TaxID=1033252 RepID=A0AAD7MI95_9AGAR|nr:kinase-like domain-containing protein [Mycena metata]
MILEWTELLAIPEFNSLRFCYLCQTSHLLPLWIGAMRHVYELDHLRSIPWNHGCHCWESSLTAAGEPFRTTPVFLHADSPVLLVLYELVVPLWPLVCWVVFRTIVKDGTVQAFLDMSLTPDRDLFFWDNEDQQELLNCNPYQRWAHHIAEIDLQTWLHIRRTTRTWNTTRYEQEMDWDMRLLALTLKYISRFKLNDLENIRVSLEDITSTLSIDVDWHIVSALTDDGEQPLTLLDPESREFWSLPNLEIWLTNHRKASFQSVWNIPNTSVLTRVQLFESYSGSFKHLARYTYCRMLKRSRRETPIDALRKLVKPFELGGWRKGYISYELDILFDFLKQSIKNHSGSIHVISTDIYESISRDIPSVVVKAVRALKEPESLENIMALRGLQAQELLNLLQDLLDLDSFSMVKPLMCKTLVALSQKSSLHPRCFSIPWVEKVGQQVDGGGFGDIWKGLVCGQWVSVKIMRIFEKDEVAAVLKEFSREALIWGQLCHPNLLPFFGLYKMEDRLCLVSPWMANGNIMQYLSNESPNIVRRLSLILDVAHGLQYLHEKNVVHGDLKAINVLVTPSGRACICDFGLASIVNEITLHLHSTPRAQRGTARYYAPELFQGNGKPSLASDVYAFASVCTEILSGQVPFHESRNDVVVMFKIVHGEHPTRPPSCSGTTQLDTLWELLQDCWSGVDLRPTAAQIVEHLLSPSIGAAITTSTADWDEQFTCKFRRSLQDQPLLPSVNQIERSVFGNEVARACKECFPKPEQEKKGNSTTTPRRLKRISRRISERHQSS